MHKKLVRIVAAVAMLGAFSLMTLESSAQSAIQLVTPYPAITSQAGKTVTLNLEALTPSRQRVDLSVVEAPVGWQAVFRGGGFVVFGTFGAPEMPPGVQLEIVIPPEAAQGEYRVLARARAGGATDDLSINIRVSDTAPGAVTLVPEFPTLSGSSTDTFRFTLTLTNNTPEETQFNLAATGPEGWVVTARPSAQTQAATISVAGGETGTVDVSADPPDDVPAGTYEIGASAGGSGKQADATMSVEVTGNLSMVLTTPTERLNADGRAGRGTNVGLVVRNDGTAPLTDVTITANPPTGWEVTFEPETISNIEPGAEGRATARITPTSESLTGDYSVSFTASSGGTNTDLEISFTVRSGPLRGLLAIGLIAAVAAGIYWLFQTYGRR